MKTLEKQIEEILIQNGLNENIKQGFHDKLGVKYGRGIIVREILTAVQQYVDEAVGGPIDLVKLTNPNNLSATPTYPFHDTPMNSIVDQSIGYNKAIEKIKAKLKEGLGK